MNSSHTAYSFWQRGAGLIIVIAGLDKRFIPNASLVFTTGSSTTDEDTDTADKESYSEMIPRTTYFL